MSETIQDWWRRVTAVTGTLDKDFDSAEVEKMLTRARDHIKLYEQSVSKLDDLTKGFYEQTDATKTYTFLTKLVPYLEWWLTTKGAKNV